MTGKEPNKDLRSAVRLTPEKEADLTAQLLELADTDVKRCIQCGRCTANCPMAQHMDLVPSRMMWELKNGRASVVLAAASPWDCLSCFACETRCPRGLNPAGVMEAARLLSIRPAGAPVLTAEEVAELDPGMPQQAIVAAYRKFSK